MATAKKRTNKISKRFEPLDYLRGLVMACIVITEQAGNENSWPFLNHSSWIGFTVVDWLFPCLIVCMGFAMVFSLKKFTKINGDFVKKILVRGLLLIIIGLTLNFCDGFFSRLHEGLGADAFMETLQHLRFYGILQRIGFVYMVSAFIIMIAKKNAKNILITSAIILLAYLFILGLGHGYEYSENSIIYIFDNSIIPYDHLYHKNINGITLSLDPEGGVSMISTIGQALLAFGIGKLFIENWKKNVEKATLALFAYSTMIIILGLLLLTFAPVIKRAWTTSFVCLTTGIAFDVIALFTFITLKNPHEKLFEPLKAIGVSALGIFVISNFLAYLFKYFSVGGQTLQSYLNGALCMLFGGEVFVASFVYSLIMLAIVWLIAWILYKNKIIIKL